MEATTGGKEGKERVKRERKIVESSATLSISNSFTDTSISKNN